VLTRAQEAGPEDGFTLVELMVVTTIMLVVLGALVGGLASLTGAERTASSHIDDEQRGRFVLASLTQDLRSAQQLVAPATVALGGASAELVSLGLHVVWSYDRAGTLTRFTVAADGVTRSVSASYTGVVNGANGPPVFAWLDPAGTDLGAQSSTTPADLARCATSVHLTLELASHTGRVPVTESAGIDLPNQPGGQGC